MKKPALYRQLTVSFIDNIAPKHSISITFLTISYAFANLWLARAKLSIISELNTHESKKYAISTLYILYTLISWALVNIENPK